MERPGRTRPIGARLRKDWTHERATGTGWDTEGRASSLSSDGKRERWDVSGPHFAGWEIYHLKGSPADPNRLYASQSTRLVRAGDSALGRRRQDVGAGGQQVRLRRRPGHSPVVRRDAAPVGVQASLASRAVADRSGHRLRRRGRRRAVPLDRRRPDLAGAARTARPRIRIVLAAWRRRAVPAHDRPRSERSSADLHRDLGGGRVPERRRRRDVAADQPRPAVRGHPRSEAEVGHCVHRIAMHRSRPGVLFMQKHWDVMRSDDAGDSWREVSGNLPTDFGFAIDVHAHEPETIYVVPIKSDSEHYPPDGKLRVYRSRTRRQRMGGADQGPAAARLLRQRPARRDGGRLARFVRRLFRDHRRPGLRARPTRATTGRRSCAIFRRCVSVEVQTLP